MKNIVIFASGGGSNAGQIMQYFSNHQQIKVVAVLTNNPQAGVLQKALQYGIPGVVFTKEQLVNGEVLARVQQFSPDVIVLAGFLLKFPAGIIAAYPDKVINIHPALLPKYGGKGMYGINVHGAVLENKEKESGITIHYVNDNYDEGNIIFQQSVAVDDCSTPEEIAARVLELEHRYYPEIIEQILNNDF